MLHQFTEQLNLLIFINICFSSTAMSSNTNNEVIKIDCGELGDCPSGPVNCHKICGCDRFAAYYYNETSGECLVSFKHLMVAVLNKYASDVNSEHGMAHKIEIEAESIFNALLISVLLFIACSAICVISACYYCCRIIYTDYVLKSDIKDLGKKINSKQKIKKTIKRPLPGPAAQSCNILCEDAGVFVV